MHDPTFGDWLRQRRRALDLTKAALAERVGCAAATIAKIEANLRRPSQQVALRLAAALEIPAAEHAAFVRLARSVSEQPAVLPTPTPEPLNRMPTPLTPLIGREPELAAISEQLAGSVRLLTLTGPPGVGKTRLALAAAQRVAAHFADGTVFVALATVHDPALLFDAIAHALGSAPQINTPAFERLVASLQQRHVLLVLDNFEQLMAMAAQLAELLSHCPTVTALVTSRERLHVRGEHQIRVPPLALAAGMPLDLAQLGQVPAVALFVATAQAARASFRLTAENALAITKLCAALDGLPLAIELAAARSDLLEPAALLDIGSQQLTAASLRDLPERQQSLHAALEWSYHLLAAPEQRLLRCVSVFVGPWSLEAAQALAGDEPISATLTALVTKSLVQHAAPSSSTPFALLETIRLYALGQLAASAEAAALAKRHAEYYRALAAQAALHLKGGDQLAWIALLQATHANLAATLAWLLGHGCYEQAGIMCRDLRRFWWLSGRWTEGRSWIGQVLAHADALTALTQAYAEVADGVLASAQGNNAAAAAAFTTALGIAQRHEEQELIGIAAHNLGSVLLTQGNHAEAQRLFNLGLALDREAGDQWGLAISLGSLAELACTHGDYATAESYYAESLAIFRQCEDHGSIAIALNNLGEVFRKQGKGAAAAAALREGVALARQHQLRRVLPALLNNQSLLALGNGDSAEARRALAETTTLLADSGSPADAATSLVVGGLLALAEQRAALAATMFAAAQQIASSQKIVLPPDDQAEIAAAIARTQAMLGGESFAAAWDTGQRYSLGEAITAIGSACSIAQ